MTTWKSVSIQGTTTIAVKTDGTLWGWGSSADGVFGTGTTVNYSSPIQIGWSLTTWSQATLGSHFVLAIKTDGSLWAWGLNANGQLGIGTNVTTSSPVQVGSGTNWMQISAQGAVSSALKTDGTLWAWGSNNVGQLGQGDTTVRSSPVQVGLLTSWRQVSVGTSALLCVRN